MNQLEADLQKVRVDLEEAEQEVLRWSARADGLRVQEAALRQALAAPAPAPSPSIDLRDLSRMRAIEELLRRSDQSMSIPEIVEGLKSSGRKGDQYQLVAATLQQLLNFQRVRRPSRGQYLAA